MSQLTARDKFHLRAAEGWLELNQHLEANKELDQITPELRAHKDVLQLRWEVHSRAGHWQLCLDLAEDFLVQDVNSPWAWVSKCISLHHLGQTREAYRVLSRQLNFFRGHAPAHYDLARYATQLGFMVQARKEIHRAFMYSKDPAPLKLQALHDPDLAPLWECYPPPT